MKNKNKGFTLVELLVVIAIIGILSSVILLSLNVARSRGADAKVKSQLANARTSAQLFHDTYNNYIGIGAAELSDCTAPNTMFQDTDSNMAQYTNPAIYPGGVAFSIRCSSTDAEYAITASLSDPTEFWCIDWTGTSKKITGADHVTAHPDGMTTCS